MNHKQGIQKHVRLGVMLAVLALTSSTTMALDASYTTDQTVAGQVDAIQDSSIAVSGGAHLTIIGDETINLTAASANDTEPVALFVEGSKLSADNLHINITPADSAVNNRPKGMIVRGNSDVNIDKLTVDVTKANRQAHSGQSPDSDAAYGVAVGYNFNGGQNTETTTMTVKDADITVANTADTVKGYYDNGINRTIFGFIRVTGQFTNGHQMSGIKVFRGNGAEPTFHATGNVNVSVADKSEAKANDYNVGVYVSGQDAKAIFDGNTNITVTANGVNSAAIKIGKPRDVGEGASVVVNGKLSVDTTGINGSPTYELGDLDPVISRGSGAIRLFDKHSNFAIIGAKTTDQSEIKASTNAIVFDTIDYANLATINAFGTFKEVLTRGIDNVDNTVTLHNTKLSTTGENDDLILANATVKERGIIYTGASMANAEGKINQYFQTGPFNVKNATFTLSGEQSTAIAAPKGYVVRAKSGIKADGTVGSTAELATTIADKAVIVGQIKQDADSKLDATLDEGARWELAPKRDLKVQRSNMNSLTITNQAVLDASSHASDDSDQGASYIIRLGQDNVATERAILAQDMTNTDSATTSEDTGASTNGTNHSASDASAIPVGTGTLSNGGIITLANQLYTDRLTIDGNYEGKAGLVKMNTEWNSPGNTEGANSTSDMLHILGSATGTSTVIPVSSDGTELMIDGTIGSIAADLRANSVPVVLADDKDGSVDAAFAGTAKTRGAGEVQLAHRVTDAGQHQWYWTITATKPEEPKPIEPDTPKVIYDPATPGYVQMPQIDQSLLIGTIRTYHERRGDNHKAMMRAVQDKESMDIKASQEASQVNGDSSQIHDARVSYPTWAKLIKDYSQHDGSRLGYTLHTKGVQVGQDRLVEDRDGNRTFTGGYVSYLRGNAKFSDRYSAQNGILVGKMNRGSGKADVYAVGVTRTHDKVSGSYVDYVGQLAYVSNEYMAQGHHKENQSGFGLAASVEAGKPYIMHQGKRSQWILEPQAQILYSYLHLRDISNGDRYVNQSNQQELVGRIGARLAHNRYDAAGNLGNSVYAVANVWQRLLPSRSIEIGQDRLWGDYARTRGEIGLGMQYHPSSSWYIYGDVRYEKNLGGSDYHGYRGNLGVKYSW